MKFFRHITIVALVALPLSALAQNFVPLVDVPYLGGPGTDYTQFELNDYIQAFYLMAITVAAFLAVVKIIFGGVKYMVSDVITDKGDAKSDIRGALLGLLIVLAAVLILNTIWSGFTNFDVFGSAIPIDIDYQNDTGFLCSLYPGRAECQDKNSDLAGYLQPNTDEELVRIPCGDYNGISADCRGALNNCRTGLGGGLRNTTGIDGQVYCYVPDNDDSSGGGASSCNGYFEPNLNVCFADDDTGSTIDLGSDLTIERDDLREIECRRLGGRAYEYDTDLCYQ